MSQGNPNTNPLDFTAKIYFKDASNPSSSGWKHLYEPPEATTNNSGVVWLSDSTSDTIHNASTGVTAATPFAVAQVANAASNKLDTQVSTDQTVVSNVTFSGKITASGGVEGSASKLGTATLGSNSKFIYLTNGSPVEATGNIGDANTPVFLDGGTIKSVDSNVFGVKGDAETDYRTGQVSLTAANIGALSLSGGTLSGDLTINGNVISQHADTYLGVESTPFARTYSNIISTSALFFDKHNSDGSLESGGNITLDGTVVDSLAISNLSTGSTYSTAIADGQIASSKLKSDVGIVQTSGTEPTDSHVKIWIQTVDDN